VSEDLANWHSITGHPTDLPITPDKNQFVVDPVPAGGGIINGGHTLVFDPSGIPVIAYRKYDAKGNSQVHVARPGSDGWQTVRVSEWDNRWAFSGPGSIESEIRLSRPVWSNSTLNIPYWHVTRGHGKLCIDTESPTLVEDRLVDAPHGPYPPELCVPKSDIPGMSVRWLPVKIGDGEDGSVSAFRWETGGKRRFYDPPEQPIPPTELIYYRFE
jgi:hypothetical protein